MKIKYLVAALSSTAIGASAAYADKPNTYVFVDSSYNNIATDIKDSSTVSAVETEWHIDDATQPVFTEDEVSDSSSGFRVGAGLNFAQNWSIEVSYAIFGTASDTIDATTLNTAAVSQLEISTRARTFTVDVARYFPVTDEFRLYGKLGLDTWTAEIRAHQLGKDADKDRDTGYMPMIGVGAQLDLGENWVVRTELSYRLYDAEYTQYLLKDNPDAGAGELDLLGDYEKIGTDIEITSFNLGIGYRF